jgi:hypothetical protein
VNYGVLRRRDSLFQCNVSLQQYCRTCSPVQFYYYHSTDVQVTKNNGIVPVIMYCSTPVRSNVLSDVKCLLGTAASTTLQRRTPVPFGVITSTIGVLVHFFTSYSEKAVSVPIGNQFVARRSTEVTYSSSRATHPIFIRTL